MDKNLVEKLEDTALDGAAISLDPEEAEELGALEDGMPLDDVLDAQHDKEA